MNERQVLKGLPWVYRFEALAKRWHTTPYAIERELDDPIVQTWVRRGMIFLNLEAVEVQRGIR